MANQTLYPYPMYESNKAAAIVLTSLIGISSIAWIIQLIQSRLKPPRMNILILISHLLIFAYFVLRSALSIDARNSKAAITATAILFAIGRRMIIIANYDYLTLVADLKPRAKLIINIGAVVLAIGSALITVPAGNLSYKPEKINTSFRLRQASTVIVVCIAVLFYPIWFATNAMKNMSKQAVILLIISSLASVISSVFFWVVSIPIYYITINQQEWWYYSFQFVPTAIALFSWSIFHPKRSLVVIEKPKETTETLALAGKTDAV